MSKRQKPKSRSGKTKIISAEFTVVPRDEVNHPAHYTSLPAKCSACGHPVECVDVVELLPFNLGNAIKYIWRSAFKGKLRVDLEKASWYVSRELARISSGSGE